jgi:hypothetical protein
MTALDTAGLAVVPLDVTVSRGADSIVARAPQIAALAESIPDLPVTARWPWLAASLTKLSTDVHPWMVSLSEGNRLVAAVILLDDLSGSVRRTTIAGAEEDHRAALIAPDAATAAHLGAALADALMGDLREFTIGPVKNCDGIAALVDCLPVGVVVGEVSVPLIYAMPDFPVGMSRGMARTLRKSRNRMATDGLEPEIDVIADGAAITELLPLLESISRDRDTAAGRHSPLDDPRRRRLWQRRVMALASVGVLRLVTLRLNGGLAAYVLGVEDGDIYRILEGRYVAPWARYAPGRVLEAAILDSVVESDELAVLDWMTGIAPETLLAANGVDPLVVIQGRTKPAAS